jgi:LPS O-antigen subunit length determinant protein (WzzB/FepE family)
MEEIQNKFLCYQTEATFKTELAAGGIGDTSIVFVLDKQYIYSHGQYFYCGFSSEVQRILTAALTELANEQKEKEDAIAEVLVHLELDKINRSEVDIDEINSSIASIGTTVETQVNASVSEAIARLNQIIEDTGIESMQKIITAAITNLERTIQEDQVATATVLNDMRNQIENLQEQINKLTTS